MKNKKTIIAISILIILIVGGIFFFTTKNKSLSETDAIKFKTEYESLNGVTKNDKTIRSITIPDDNPFVYQTADEIVEKINNKETFAVYFGFPNCPWCRSVIPTLIEVAKQQKVDKIYYVDVKDIRDTMELDEKNNPITTKKGSDGYYKLTEVLEEVLEDYTLTDKNKNTVKTGTKRIYAPNIVSIINGKATKLTTGISSKQTDAYMELTDEIKNDTKNQITEVLEEFTGNGGTCDPLGC